MWITGDKQNLLKIDKVSIFKSQVGKVFFFWQITGGQSVICHFLFCAFLFTTLTKK